MGPDERRDYVLQARFCLNCLANSHERAQCNSLSRCHRCEGYHHTLLHIELYPQTRTISGSESHYSAESSAGTQNMPRVQDAAVQCTLLPHGNIRVRNTAVQCVSLPRSERILVQRAMDALQQLQELLR